MTTDDYRESLEARLEKANTQIRRLQTKYERSQRTLDSIQNLLPEFPIPFVVVAADGTIVYSNNAANDLLETSDHAGGRWRDLGCCEGADDDPVALALSSGKLQKTFIMLPSGARKACIAKPIVLGDGREAALMICLDAPTPPSELSEKEFQNDKMSTLGELISGIAHELNNPLTGVIGFSELLSYRDHDPKTGEMIQKVLREANRCKRIVANLLSFSRKHHPQRSRVEINDLLREVVELLSYELRVANIRVAFRLDPRLPPTMADPYLMQQVFFNIIHNALQAMASQPDGGDITILTATEDDNVIVSMTDTGPGMPKQIQEQVFDPFFTTKAEHSGTGLGLSISHKIVKRHGGDLTVWSEPNAGASFRISLPIVASPAASPIRSRPQVVSAQRGNILVVDDEQPILDLLEEVLKNKEHRVTATQRASEALRVMGDQPYDCIISDIKMPELDGREFYELVKTMQPEMAKRLIFITGDYLCDATAEFVRDAGIPYLKKPFSPDELLAVTQRVLSTSRSTPGDAPTA